jgi:hypothetical protein
MYTLNKVHEDLTFTAGVAVATGLEPTVAAFAKATVAGVGPRAG